MYVWMDGWMDVHVCGLQKMDFLNELMNSALKPSPNHFFRCSALILRTKTGFLPKLSGLMEMACGIWRAPSLTVIWAPLLPENG